MNTGRHVIGLGPIPISLQPIIAFIIIVIVTVTVIIIVIVIAIVIVIVIIIVNVILALRNSLYGQHEK